jgi:hypothetical protein
MSQAVLSLRTRALFILCMLIAGIILPSNPAFALKLGESTIASQDWRQEQVGSWDCQGVSTLEGAEMPYYGHLTNEWAPDGLTLILRFNEYHPFGEPFQEEQRWNVVELTDTHSRVITTNDGSAAVVVAQEPQDGVMQWEGAYVTSQGAVQLSETITRVSADEYYWLGTVTLGLDELGYYALTCTRISS